MSPILNCSYISSNQTYIEILCDISNNFTYCCPVNSNRICSQSKCSTSVSGGDAVEDIPLKDPVVFWYFLSGLLVLGLIVLMLTYLFFKNRKANRKRQSRDHGSNGFRVKEDTVGDDLERAPTAESGDISYRDKFRKHHEDDMLSRGSSRIVLVENNFRTKQLKRWRGPSKLPIPIYNSDSPKSLTPRDTPTQLPDVG